MSNYIFLQMQIFSPMKLCFHSVHVIIDLAQEVKSYQLCSGICISGSTQHCVPTLMPYMLGHTIGT